MKVSFPRSSSSRPQGKALTGEIFRNTAGLEEIYLAEVEGKSVGFASHRVLVLLFMFFLVFGFCLIVRFCIVMDALLILLDCCFA